LAAGARLGIASRARRQRGDTTRITETLDFYFDFTSPYGYIASQVIAELAARPGCATRWHAFMVTAAYKQLAATNPLAHPAKQKYFRHDIPRTAAHLGVPFTFPATWPENLVAAGRAFSWTPG